MAKASEVLNWFTPMRKLPKDGQKVFVELPWGRGIRIAEFKVRTWDYWKVWNEDGTTKWLGSRGIVAWSAMPMGPMVDSV